MGKTVSENRSRQRSQVKMSLCVWAMTTEASSRDVTIQAGLAWERFRSNVFRPPSIRRGMGRDCRGDDANGLWLSGIAESLTQISCSTIRCRRYGPDQTPRSHGHLSFRFGQS
ncbi:uncharacterized protein VTP21DRAFT_3561 [Calcarisporiella thermophila]|uniref:uncharacterized protein n=1 Tax=Calcarisporiella thermophila TaxID=911321 RepID=UPI00374357EB